jgi:hypothetical protein
MFVTSFITLLREYKPKLLSHHISATVTLDTIVVFHTIAAFGNPIVALLTSSPAMWR